MGQKLFSRHCKSGLVGIVGMLKSRFIQIRLFLTIFTLLSIQLVFLSTAAAETAFEQSLKKLRGELSSNKKAKISLLVRTLESNPVDVLLLNESRALVPASVVKIITTAAALRDLGAEYRFPTEVFVDRLPNEQNIGLNKSAGLSKDKNRWHAGSLYLRGYGDPSLTDERLWELAREVARRGVSEVVDIVVDDSLFIKPPGPSGVKPYQAGLSAVALNHNCYAVHVSPRGVGMKPHWRLTDGAPYEVLMRAFTKRGRATLSLGQSPSSSGFSPSHLFGKDSRGLIVGAKEAKITIQGGINHEAEPKTFYRTVPYPPSYLASVFRELLGQVGVKVTGQLVAGKTPLVAKRLLKFESKPLFEILTDLNHYSSNFIAGQIQFALGQGNDGFFRLEDGLSAIRQVLIDLEIPASEFSLADASGLSRGNSLSAEHLVKVLHSLNNDFSKYPTVASSLSRFGASGTLVDRELLSQKDEAQALRFELDTLRQRSQGVWGKTGTLTGVSSLTGYLELPTGQRAAFAMITNGISKAQAVELEDKVVRALIGVGRNASRAEFGIK